jgi:hypothetical protein
MSNNLNFKDMKKLIIALTALFTITVTANAMSYEQARNEALFLTDKMAYELNLTQEQYNAAYEVNLDYLMNIGGYNDVDGVYWTRRNMDLSYILFDWQFDLYRDATYFYRPIYWGGGYWHFGVYGRYPHRDFYYFDRPDVFMSYRGGHSWGRNGGDSFYRGRRMDNGIGMRDAGQVGNGMRGVQAGNGSRNGQQNGSFNGSRSGHESSTRTTVNRTFNADRGTFSSSSSSNSNGAFGGSRSVGSSTRNSSTYSNSRGSVNGSNYSSGSSSNGAFGGSRSSSYYSSPRSSSSSSYSAPSRSYSSPSSSSSSFGGSRSSSYYSAPSSSSSSSYSAPSRSYSSPSSGSSFGGSRSSGSFGGGSSTRSSGGSFGGGGSRSGGGSFGGHR